MTMVMQRGLGSVQPFARWLWYGSGNITTAHMFLGVGVWNALMMAMTVTWAPRMSSPETVALYMKLPLVYLPAFLSFVIAALFNLMYGHAGLRAWVKATVMVGIIVLITWLLWSPQSQAWLDIVTPVELK